jgi:hypothetical protein
MGLFQEYLNSKGSVEKAKVSITGDFVDPMTSPNAPKGGKPYGVSDGKKLKMAKEKGFGDEGDSKLKYTPKVDNSNGVTAAKIPTAEQAELCGVLIDAIKKDPTIAEQLVFQLRHNGQMGAIVAEMLQFKETYQHIAEVMSHKQYGPTICSKLVRAMNEEVAPPFAASLEGDETEDDEDQSDDDDFSGEEDEDFSDEEAALNSEPMMAGQAGAPMAPQAPPQMPPPGASAMKNFQMAMMGKR